MARLGEQTVPQVIRDTAEKHLLLQFNDVQTMPKSSWAFVPEQKLESDEGPGGPEYLPVLLSHPVDDGTVITGVAVLVVPEDRRFTYPTRLAIELSKRAEQMGDVLE